jgi:hypothetical protein
VNLNDALARTEQALLVERHIDVGLDGLLDETPSADRARWLAQVEETLKERIGALKVARNDLRRLAKLAEHLGEILPFTSEGWPARREQLSALLGEDPSHGLAEWLADWFAAASCARLDALERLEHADLPLPPGADCLVDRAATAAAGLSQRYWHLAEPMLTAGREGLEVHGHLVALSDATLRDLDLLAARMAIESGLDDLADGSLRRAEAHGAQASAAALRVRLLRGDADGEDSQPADTARRRLMEARAAEPGNLDVAAELIHNAHRSSSDGEGDAASGSAVETALDLARAAIGALASLADIDDQLARLMMEIPSEIRIAVAERAIEERAWELALSMLDLPDPAASNELLALGAEHRAQILAAQGQAADEQAAALVAAGQYRAWAQQFDRARADYELALELEPEHVSATLGLADALRLSSAGGPASAVVEPMSRVAELIGVLRDREVLTTSESWGYLVEADAWTEAGRHVGPDRDEILWRALLAATRATVHQPALSSRWQALVDTAGTLNMHEVALLCAQRAILVTHDADPTAAHIQALANAVRPEEARSAIAASEASDAWIQTVSAFLLLREGNAEEALRVLQAADIHPLWYWARTDMIDALILSGRGASAARAAESLLADLERSRDSWNALAACAYAANVCGRPQEAQSWAGQLSTANVQRLSGNASALVAAEAALLQNDTDDFLTELECAVARAGRGELAAWKEMTRGRLQWLAQQAGVELPNLDRIEAQVAERAALLSETDGIQELLAAAAGHGADSAASAASELLAPLLEWVRNDADHALAMLPRSDAGGVEDPEVAQLRLQLTSATATESDPPANAEVERQASAESPPVQQAEVRLELPPSWFAADENPVQTHPLFLRFLPEMRVRLKHHGPGVMVNTDSQLEPDGYRVLIGGETVRSGSVPQEWRYCRTDAAELLPSAVSESSELDPNLGLLRIPAELAQRADGAAQLLTMPAIEVVTRILGETAERHAERIWQADLATLDAA